VALSYTPCRYARRWPDLWARLPTDEDCREVSEALAKHSVAGVCQDFRRRRRKS
jgi:hypothetical protein